MSITDVRRAAARRSRASNEATCSGRWQSWGDCRLQSPSCRIHIAAAQLNNPSQDLQREKKHCYYIISPLLCICNVLFYNCARKEKIIDNNSEKQPVLCNYCCLHWIMSQFKWIKSNNMSGCVTRLTRAKRTTAGSSSILCCHLVSPSGCWGFFSLDRVVIKKKV